MKTRLTIVAAALVMTVVISIGLLLQPKYQGLVSGTSTDNPDVSLQAVVEPTPYNTVIPEIQRTQTELNSQQYRIIQQYRLILLFLILFGIVFTSLVGLNFYLDYKSRHFVRKIN